MKLLRRFLTDLALVAAAVAVATLVLMLGLYTAGYPAHLVVGKWIDGAIGTRFDFLVALKNTTPLLLTGLAAGIAFRSGVFNIGAEGQSILGAIATAFIATRIFPQVGSGWVAIPLALGAAVLAGAGYAAIASLLDRYRAVPVVLSTILLNFIAIHLLSLLLEGPLKAAGTEIVQSDPVPAAYFLPILSQVGSLHAGILIAVAAAGALWIVQARTTFGFEIQAVGLNPVAARLAGMPVESRQIAVMLLSGGFAGMAGSLQILGVSHYLGTDSPGYGYTGIAVALLGRLHPAGIALAALFFALLDQGATNVEISTYQLPREVADIVKGLVVVMLLIAAAYLAYLRSNRKEHA
jgi:simple sugar transport system permease protein